MPTKKLVIDVQSCCKRAVSGSFKPTKTGRRLRSGLLAVGEGGSYVGLMQRRRRFEDPRSECVWAAIETLDAGLQREVLRELATVHALSLEDPRTTADKVRAAVSALRDVAEILGHSPSVKEYRAVCKELSELKIPSEPTVRRWLGAGWNDCLTRALLDAVADGDFASRPIGFSDRFDDDEVFAALRECADELGHPPTVTEYFGWARRPDVRDRLGRRPSSFKPFERFGNFRGALTAAGVIGENEARYSANGRILPLRYAYSDDDIGAALLTVARRLRRSPRPAEYHRERQRIYEDALVNGEIRPIPTVDVIRKRHGDWNAALTKAGLEPVEHPSQPHLGRPRPTYTDAEKLEWLRRAWKELGEPFTAHAYKHWRATKIRMEAAAIPCLPTVERTFGGWKNARRLALPGAHTNDPGQHEDE